jgi:hypothetical protein
LNAGGEVRDIPRQACTAGVTGPTQLSTAFWRGVITAEADANGRERATTIHGARRPESFMVMMAFLA